jgi:CHAD domain-containing protein
VSYRLKPGRQLIDSIKEIAADHATAILSYLGRSASQGDAVHQARKAIKRLRALLVLIRPAISFTDYKTTQEHLKSVARSVANLRDAQAMLGTIAKIARNDPVLGASPVAAALSMHLEARRAAQGQQVNRTVGTAARKTVRDVRTTFAQLTLTDDSFKPIEQSLEVNYGAARRAMKHAFDVGHDAAFHEWRKLVQRHWRHLQLLEEVWPKGIQPHIALARHVSEILGDDHDFSVLAALATTEAEALGDADVVDAYVTRCLEHQAALRKEAAIFGARCFAEKPRSFAARMRIYWDGACLKKE